MLRAARTMLAVSLLGASVMCAGALPGPAAGASQRASVSDLPDFEGPVIAIDGHAHTFKVRDHHRGVVKFKVNSGTRYEHLSGFGALRKSMRVDVEARRSRSKWIAVHVEREHD